MLTSLPFFLFPFSQSPSLLPYRLPFTLPIFSTCYSLPAVMLPATCHLPSTIAICYLLFHHTPAILNPLCQHAPFHHLLSSCYGIPREAHPLQAAPRTGSWVTWSHPIPIPILIPDRAPEEASSLALPALQPWLPLRPSGEACPRWVRTCQVGKIGVFSVWHRPTWGSLHNLPRPP